MRAIQATNPDMVFVGSYPPDTVGMVRAANEVGLKAKMFGGGMVGLQATAIKTQLGPLLNGIVDYDFWLPVATFATPEALAFLKKYQAKAAGAGVDALGYYLPPFAYADMQVLQQAIEGTEEPGPGQARRLSAHPDVPYHGWRHQVRAERRMDQPRVLAVQFRGVTGHDLEQFKDPKTEVVLWPPALQTGTLQSPYDEAKH